MKLKKKFNRYWVKKFKIFKNIFMTYQKIEYLFQKKDVINSLKKLLSLKHKFNKKIYFIKKI